MLDEWNFYNRECTSFVAWCLNSRNGIPFTNQYAGAARWGNAGDWGHVARSLGFAVDGSPAVGAVAWWSGGHVGWVSAVNGSSVYSGAVTADMTAVGGYGSGGRGFGGGVRREPDNVVPQRLVADGTGKRGSGGALGGDEQGAESLG